MGPYDHMVALDLGCEEPFKHLTCEVGLLEN